VKKLIPKTALDLGLKVDSEARPPSLVAAIKHGTVNLDDPAVTLQLLQQNAVLGVVGTFNNNALTKVGFTCALCHLTVDDSVAPGIDTRIDGLGNHDLNVGAIIASAPNLQPFVKTAESGAAERRRYGTGCSQRAQQPGPGKFDAELGLDGKACNPRQMHFYQLSLPAVAPP